MSQSILVIGESGCGKSTAIAKLDAQSTFLINTIGKELPFKGSRKLFTAYDAKTQKGNMLATTNHDVMIKILKGIDEKLTHIKQVVIDDSQYIMSFEFMKRAKEKGFDKFVEIAQHYFNVITTAQALRNDLTVFFLSHSEDVGSNGNFKTKIKTVGKMLDEKITIEGLFTIVLHAQARKNEKKIEHYFLTNSDGTTTAKSPAGMFDLEIPNDLSLVLQKVKAYYEGE